MKYKYKFRGDKMPTIWNTIGSSNIENRKLTSKLTFSGGEKFSGKIIKKDGNNVTIKLSDGWQFKAEIDEEINLENQGNFKFVVEDIKEGKLKLKVVKDSNLNKEEVVKDKLLLKFIKSEGLSKEDIPILKEMLKREIPLTKENINKFKELTNFFESIKGSKEDSDKFITNYLRSKGIADESSRGIEIKNILKEFMGSIKTLSKEEFMILIENNIDLNKENIEAFSKLFKSENELTELLKNIEKEVLHAKSIAKGIAIEEKNIIENKNLMEDSIEGDEKLNNIKRIPINNSYNGIEEKVSVVDLLKSMTNSKEINISSLINNIIIGENTLDTDEFNSVLKTLKNLTEENLIELLKENVSMEIEENNQTNLVESKQDSLKGKKEDLEGNYKTKIIEIKGKIFTEKNITEVISKLIDKEVKISQSDCEKIIGILDSADEEIFLAKEKLKSEVILKDILKPINKEIEENIKEKLNSFKILNDMMKNEDIATKGSERLALFIKNNFSEFKMLNNLSNEYYYLDIPVKVRNDEYPCKLIIKDNRKDDKKIDKNNIKVVVSVKTLNLGTIDSYLHFTNNNLRVTFKCNEESIKPLEFGINKLKEALKELKFNLKIEIIKKEEEVTIANCRDFFANKENRMVDRMV